MNLYLLFFFILFCFFLSLIERKTHINYIKWLIILPFCIITATRSVKVPDTEAYLEFFNATDPFSFDDFGNFSFEIGFQVFTKIMKLIVADNFVLYLASFPLINLLSVNFSINQIGKLFKADLENDSRFLFVGENRFLKNSFFSILPLTLYIAFYGIYTNAIVLRVGMAFSILLLVSTYILKPNKTFFDFIVIIFLSVLGYFFHITFLIGLLVIFIMLSKNIFSNKIYFWIWASIGLTYFVNLTSKLGDNVFSFISSLNELSNAATKLTSSYEGNVVQEVGGVSLKFVFFWIMAFVLIINNKPSKIYFKLLNVYLTGIALFAVFRSVTLIERVTDFFLLFSFLIFYLFLITQRLYKFWLFFVSIVLIQVIFIIRITN